MSGIALGNLAGMILFNSQKNLRGRYIPTLYIKELSSFKNRK